VWDWGIPVLPCAALLCRLHETQSVSHSSTSLTQRVSSFCTSLVFLAGSKNNTTTTTTTHFSHFFSLTSFTLPIMAPSLRRLQISNYPLCPICQNCSPSDVRSTCSSVSPSLPPILHAHHLLIGPHEAMLSRRWRQSDMEHMGSVALFNMDLMMAGSNGGMGTNANFVPMGLSPFGGAGAGAGGSCSHLAGSGSAGSGTSHDHHSYLNSTVGNPGFTTLSENESIMGGGGGNSPLSFSRFSNNQHEVSLSSSSFSAFPSAFVSSSSNHHHHHQKSLLPCLNCLIDVKCLFCEKKLSSFAHKFFMRKYFVGAEKDALRERYWAVEEDLFWDSDAGDATAVGGSDVIFTCSNEEMVDHLEYFGRGGREEFGMLLYRHYPLFLASYFLSLQSFPHDVRLWIWRKHLKSKKIRKTASLYCCKWCMEKQFTTDTLMEDLLLDMHLDEYFSEKQTSQHDVSSSTSFISATTVSTTSGNTSSTTSHGQHSAATTHSNITASLSPTATHTLSQLYFMPHHAVKHTTTMHHHSDAHRTTLDLLSDDMIAYVCSFLYFPHCMFSLCAVNETLCDYFLNRTNFSWVNQISLSHLEVYVRSSRGVIQDEILIDSNWIYLFTKLFSDLKRFQGFSNLTSVSIVTHSIRRKCRLSDFDYLCFFSGLRIDVSKLSSISIPSWSHFLNSYFLKNKLNLQLVRALDFCQDPLLNSPNILGSLLDVQYSRESSAHVGEHFVQGTNFKFFRFVPTEDTPKMDSLTLLSLHEGVFQTRLLTLMPSLCRLYLRKCSVYDDLPDDHAFPSIEVFHCKYAPVSGHSLRFFSRLHEIFPSLLKLAVYGPEEYLQTCLHHSQQITDVSLRVSVIHQATAIEALSKYQQLQSLKVNTMSDFSSTLIHRWKVQHSLKHFHCFNFHMTTQSISALIRFFPSLESLVLNDSTSASYQSDLAPPSTTTSITASADNKNAIHQPKQQGLFTLLFQYLNHLQHINIGSKAIISDIVSSMEYMKNVRSFSYTHKTSSSAGAVNDAPRMVPASDFINQLNKMTEERRSFIEIFCVNIMTVNSEQLLSRLVQLLPNVRELHCCLTSASILSKRLENLFVKRRVEFTFQVCESPNTKCTLQ